MLKLSAIVILVALFAGCAQAPVKTTTFAHQTMGQAEFMGDRYACMKEAATGTVADGVMVASYGTGVAQQFTRTTYSCSAFLSCMYARGYSRDPNGPLVAPPEAVFHCTK